jgi:hypothetical protein
MQTVLLVPILALVAAHRDENMLQDVVWRHLVSCAFAVVQRHFPVGRNVHLSSIGDEDDHAKSVLEVKHRLERWPVQVTETSRDPVLPPNLEKINAYIILTRSVKDFTVHAEKFFSVLHGTAEGCF